MCHQPWPWPHIVNSSCTFKLFSLPTLDRAALGSLWGPLRPASGLARLRTAAPHPRPSPTLMVGRARALLLRPNGSASFRRPPGAMISATAIGRGRAMGVGRSGHALRGQRPQRHRLQGAGSATPDARSPRNSSARASWDASTGQPMGAPPGPLSTRTARDGAAHLSGW